MLAFSSKAHWYWSRRREALCSEPFPWCTGGHSTGTCKLPRAAVSPGSRGYSARRRPPRPAARCSRTRASSPCASLASSFIGRASPRLRVVATPSMKLVMARAATTRFVPPLRLEVLPRRRSRPVSSSTEAMLSCNTDVGDETLVCLRRDESADVTR